jgi:hypothetical protein
MRAFLQVNRSPSLAIHTHNSTRSFHFPFFGFFGDHGEDGKSKSNNDRENNSFGDRLISQDAKAVAAAAATAIAAAAAKKLLFDEELFRRMSVQHAHPLGPWTAILGAVTDRHAAWTLEQEALEVLPTAGPRRQFRVLDLASGPRGEPGTTVAHAIGSALVHCTDSCAVAVAAIPTAVDVKKGGKGGEEGGEALSSPVPVPAVTAITPEVVVAIAATDSAAPIAIAAAIPIPVIAAAAVAAAAVATIAPPILRLVTTATPPPPRNLTKSVVDMSDLSSFESNTTDAVLCCYGCALSPNLASSLREAHRVLVVGGILVTATWESSAMSKIGQDVLASVRNGGYGGGSGGYDDAFCFRPEVGRLALSGEGELQNALILAGFEPDQIRTVSGLRYPFDLGSTSADQLHAGTVLVREELEGLGAFDQEEQGSEWNNAAEEGFFTNIGKYADVAADGTMLLRDNIFKLTVATKAS